MDLETERLIGSLPDDFRHRVRNIYLVGSRAWRPERASPTTDYDFFMVIDDYDGEEHGIHPNLPGMEANVDVSAYSTEKWRQRVLSHELLSLMCLYLPKQYVWKQDYIVPHFRFSLKRMVRGVMMERWKCWDKARRFFRDGDPYFGKKNIIHGLRYMMFGMQWVAGCETLDVACATHVYEEVMGNTSVDWNEFHGVYNQRFIDTAESLKEAVRVKTSQFIAKINNDIKGSSNNWLEEAKSIVLISPAEMLLSDLCAYLACEVESDENMNIHRVRIDRLESPGVEKCQFISCLHGLFMRGGDNAGIVASLGPAPFVWDESAANFSSQRALPLLQSASTILSVPVGSRYVVSWDIDQIEVYCASDEIFGASKTRWRSACKQHGLRMEEILQTQKEHWHVWVLRSVGNVPSYLYSVSKSSGALVIIDAFQEHADAPKVPQGDNQRVLADCRTWVSNSDPQELACLLVLCQPDKFVEFPAAARVALEDIVTETKLEMSPTRIIALVRATWPTNVSSLLPEMFRRFYEEMFGSYSSTLNTIETAWELLKKVEDDSAFGAMISTAGSKWKIYNAALFKLRITPDVSVRVVMAQLALQCVTDMVTKHMTLIKKSQQ